MSKLQHAVMVHESKTHAGDLKGGTFVHEGGEKTVTLKKREVDALHRQLNEWREKATRVGVNAHQIISEMTHELALAENRIFDLERGR